VTQLLLLLPGCVAALIVSHSGHSKGGDDVILYAKLHGDIPLVINVAGRFDLTEGIEQRFGAEIFTRVLHDQPVMLPAQRDDGKTWTWQLTAEVRCVVLCCAVPCVVLGT
jgi:hypothetical protein